MNKLERPLISVIMPVYNTGKYLAESIESVLNQSFSDWELICVNDGSTDNSLEILNSYAAKDTRIKVYSQQQSGSISKARNKALEHVSGEYIAMLDSDDKYDSDTLSLIQKRIDETKAQFILFNLCFCNADFSIIKRELKGVGGNTSVVLSGKDAFIESLTWKIGGCGAVHESIIGKFKYDATGHNGDELSTRIFFLNSESVAFTEGKYFYRTMNESTSRSFSEKIFYTLDTELALLKIIYDNKWAIQSLPAFQKRYFSKVLDKKIFYFLNKTKLSEVEKNRVNKYLKTHFEGCKNFNIDNIKQFYTSPLKFFIIKLVFKFYFIFYISAFVQSCKK